MDTIYTFCWELATIDIPDSVTTIKESAFLRCRSLTSIDIPSKVSGIEENTFLGCVALVSVVIPSSVTKIISYAFAGCTALTSFTNLNPEPLTSAPGISFYQRQSLIINKLSNKKLNKIVVNWKIEDVDYEWFIFLFNKKNCNDF